MGKLLPFVALFLLILSATAADHPPSTPAERARLVKAAKLMQQKPLSREARQEGLWALQWTTNVPDINLTICGSFSPGYKYEGQMMASDVLSMGAFVVKNPKKAADQNAVWRAGVEGMLATYDSILLKDSVAHDDFYDDVKQQRADDNLVQFMHEFGVHCYRSGDWSRT